MIVALSGLKPSQPRLLQSRIIIGGDVVQADNPIAAIKQAMGHVGADEARRSGDENVCHGLTGLALALGLAVGHDAQGGDGPGLLAANLSDQIEKRAPNVFHIAAIRQAFKVEKMIGRDPQR